MSFGKGNNSVSHFPYELNINNVLVDVNGSFFTTSLKDIKNSAIKRISSLGTLFYENFCSI